MAKSTSQIAKERPASLQDEQQRLMQRAAKQPGVAETIETYGRLARYGGPLKNELPAIRYATGGNLVIRFR